MSIHKSWFYEGPRPQVFKRKGISIAVSGRTIAVAAPSFILDGVSMCHIRSLAEAMGATVSWEQPALMVTMTRGTRSARCQVGSEVAVSNGAGVVLDQVPIFLGEYVFVPVRFVAETLGYKVTYRSDITRVDLTPA